MFENLPSFFLHWGLMSLSLWVVSHVFDGIRFRDTSSLIVAALLLGFANTLVKPLLVLLTLPLTVLTLGFFLLVINALMLLLVSALVRGFTVSGFWTAFFASIFIAVLGFLMEMALGDGSVRWQPTGGGRWV